MGCSQSSPPKPKGDTQQPHVPIVDIKNVNVALQDHGGSASSPKGDPNKKADTSTSRGEGEKQAGANATTPGTTAGGEGSGGGSVPPATVVAVEASSPPSTAGAATILNINKPQADSDDDVKPRESMDSFVEEPSSSTRDFLFNSTSSRGSVGYSSSRKESIPDSSSSTTLQNHFTAMPDFKARTSSYVIDKKRNKCESFTPFDALPSSIVDLSTYGPELVNTLPRGGVAVTTSLGPIQFGAPPETIKDSLSLGLPVPTYFVVHGNMFSRRRGICTAELEFPAYFNYFILKKKITIITTPDIEERIRTIFQETLMGPAPESVTMGNDFHPDVPVSAYPDVKGEAEWLDSARKTMKVDSLLTFIHFQSSKSDSLDSMGSERSERIMVNIEGAGKDEGKGVKITYDPHTDMFCIFNTGEGDNMGEVKSVTIPKDTMHHFTDKRFDDLSWGKFLCAEDKGGAGTGTGTGGSPLSPTSDSGIKRYEVPQFGVTMLGASHGFDSEGTTTGFILWMRRRGILVDPPPHGIDLLERNGVSHKFIDGIILTHCHGDHDAGTFRSLFFDRGLTLYTTRTIFDSFLRKYSAVSGFSEAFLTELIRFHPVRIGEKLCVNGGVIDFFYSLHTIPCIGLKASCGGKTCCYSADTHMNPNLVMKMYGDGAIGEGRRDALINFPWEADLILHEAGVPPIHTPLDILAALSPEIKSRLYLVHVTPKTIKPESGLRVASAGQTMGLEISEGQHNVAVQALNLFRRISLLAPCFQTMDDAMQVLQGAVIESFVPSETIISKSKPVQKFYVITQGVVSVEIENSKGEVLQKYYSTGDFFGESLVMKTESITAGTITARTHVQVVSLNKILFLNLVQNTEVASTMTRLAGARLKESWFAMESCKAIKDMTITEKTHLESFFTTHNYDAGGFLWKSGEGANRCVLIVEGEFTISVSRVLTGGKSREENIGILRRGALVGDINAIMSKGNSQTSFRCTAEGSVLAISQKDLLKFFKLYPGALVNFKGSFYSSFAGCIFFSFPASF